MPKKIPEIPDREDFDANEWGNIKHPTLSEEEVLRKNWNKVTANQNRDPAFKKKISDKINAFYKTKKGKKHKEKVGKKSKARHKNPLFVKIWKKKHKNATQQLSWQQKHQNNVEKLAKDPNWQKALKQGLKKRAKNNWYKKNQQAVKEKLEKYAIKCQVKEPGKPWRTFIGPKAAAKYYNWNNLRSHAKKVFPEDGSIKTWAQGKTGWQTRRIID